MTELLMWPLLTVSLAAGSLAVGWMITETLILIASLIQQDTNRHTHQGDT